MATGSIPTDVNGAQILFNQVEFTGNLLREPVAQTTSGNKAVTYGRIGVNLLDQNKKNTGSLYIDVAAYGAAAAFLAGCKTGQLISVRGRMDSPQVYVPTDDKTPTGQHIVVDHPTKAGQKTIKALATLRMVAFQISRIQMVKSASASAAAPAESAAEEPEVSFA